VQFAPLPTTTSLTTLAAAAAAAAAAQLPVRQPAPRLRRLFETAAALRRRHVYAEAQKRGIERLAWPGLVSSTDHRHRVRSMTAACSSPADAVSSDYEARKQSD